MANACQGPCSATEGCSLAGQYPAEASCACWFYTACDCHLSRYVQIQMLCASHRKVDDCSVILVLMIWKLVGAVEALVSRLASAQPLH